MNDSSLTPTRFIDSTEPGLVGFVQKRTAGLRTDREKAVALYYAVRDGVKYDPYSFNGSADTLTASKVIEAGKAFCVPKAIALAAACRAAGIPARLGFADVRNHLTTDKLKARMKGQTDFVFHGYTEIFLDGRWIKVTPTFNVELCEKFGVKPLDWDGTADALFHPFDSTGRKHMEYIRYHGTFDDLPLEQMFAAWKAAYGPDVLTLQERDGDFQAEAAPIVAGRD